MTDASPTVDVRGRTAYLTVKEIQRETILTIARALREEPNGTDLINALEHLGETDIRGAYERELTELVEEVEALSGMRAAQVRLSADDLAQLTQQAGAAVDALSPTQRDAKAVDATDPSAARDTGALSEQARDLLRALLDGMDAPRGGRARRMSDMRIMLGAVLRGHSIDACTTQLRGWITDSGTLPTANSASCW